MRTQRGFTLIEVLVVVAILSIIGVLVFGGGGFGLTEANKEQIEEQAVSHVRALGYTLEGLSCVDTDTDNDGYVSCTARVKEMPQPYAFECGTGMWSTGCRQPKPSAGRW